MLSLEEKITLCGKAIAEHEAAARSFRSRGFPSDEYHAECEDAAAAEWASLKKQYLRASSARNSQ